MPSREDPDKVRAVLIAILQQWLEVVTSLGQGQQSYLLFELDDQATGWLRITLTDDGTYRVEPVWATPEGYEFSPSRFLNMLGEVRNVEPILGAAPLYLTRDRLNAAIRQSLSTAGWLNSGERSG